MTLKSSILPSPGAHFKTGPRPEFICRCQDLTEKHPKNSKYEMSIMKNAPELSFYIEQVIPNRFPMVLGTLSSNYGPISIKHWGSKISKWQISMQKSNKHRHKSADPFGSAGVWESMCGRFPLPLSSVLPWGLESHKTSCSALHVVATARTWRTLIMSQWQWTQKPNGVTRLLYW